MPSLTSSAIRTLSRPHRYRGRHLAPRAGRAGHTALVAAGVVPVVASPIMTMVLSDDSAAAAERQLQARMVVSTTADEQAFTSSRREGSQVNREQLQASRQWAAQVRHQQAVARAEARARAAAKAKAAAEKRRIARLAELGPQAIAADLVSRRGWGSDQFQCLVSLWNKESGWRVTADNPTSSAYGIPQALPGAKMATAGADWRTNPRTQISWGLGYIAGRYGTPCAAWGHSQAVNWY